MKKALVEGKGGDAKTSLSLVKTRTKFVHKNVSQYCQLRSDKKNQKIHNHKFYKCDLMRPLR